MSDVWSKAKCEAFREAFLDFLQNVYINSKDSDEPICLADHVYDAQQRLLDEIIDGLSKGIRSFFILKSRQLGVSTFARAITLFWLGYHKGLKGAMVFDSEPNRNNARTELEEMCVNLPDHIGFPKIGSSNRDMVLFGNQSKISLLAAGKKVTKTNKGLGASLAISFAHCSELADWGNPEGLEAFRQCFSEVHPNRLYIWESTARGYDGVWYDLWEEAKNDQNHSKCIFLGWYLKPSQKIRRTDPDFNRYGVEPPSEKEAKMIADVKDQYQWDITPEQLAWYRRKMDPGGDEEKEVKDYSDNTYRLQEQPSTEQEAFQMTGAKFFDPEALTGQAHKNASPKYKTYAFGTGMEFFDMSCRVATNARERQLKVWEEPESDAAYILCADVAYGSDETNDRSAFSVLRCYADGLDQVAEYAWPLVNTRQYAWVIAALAGWYSSKPNTTMNMIIEVNGPGEAVWNELQSLKNQISNRYKIREFEEKGLHDIFRNVYNYLYTRSDSMSPGSAYHWKCLSLDTKLPTPTGWTTMGDVKAGDFLISDGGNPTRVLMATEPQYGHKCYRIVFDDGSSVIADSDHKWMVTHNRKSPQDREERISSTKDLIPGKSSIRVSSPFNLPDIDLPIHPYVLGVWLGDGWSATGKICAHTEDIVNIGNMISDCGYELLPASKEKGRNVWNQRIVGFSEKLNSLGLINNKHIPPIYLRSSFDQRLSLLQGLMDTDGTVVISSGSQYSFSSSNPRLSYGFSELIRSLGFKVKKCVRHRKIMYRGELKECKPADQFWFTSYRDIPVFRMQRKLDKVIWSDKKRHGRSKRHKIVSVDPIESVPVKCISVDSPSHLYLAGDGMVPTHNTSGQIKVAIMERLRDFVTNGMLVIKSMETLEEMKRISREGDSIAGQGASKDDRVMALAMGIRCWDERVRKRLIAEKRTRANEEAKRRLSVVDQVKMFNDSMLTQFFATKSRGRKLQQISANREKWRRR